MHEPRRKESVTSYETVVSVFGWMTVINGAALILATLALYALRPFVMRVHQRFVDLAVPELDRAYFAYLSQFKLLWLFLNLVPYLALRFAA